MNAKSGMKCAKSRDYALMLGVINDLKARPEMDMDHVYLLGESLGADAGKPRCMSGCTRPGPPLIVSRNRKRMDEDG